MSNTFLTQEGFDKLQDELNYLRKNKRQEVADRLREASDGEDLIENAEYEAAKNEQAFVEGRIKELEILLATAKIIEDKTETDSIQVGSTVTIQELARMIRKLYHRWGSGSTTERRSHFERIAAWTFPSKSSQGRRSQCESSGWRF
jgi:DNA primase large subunit